MSPSRAALHARIAGLMQAEPADSRERDSLLDDLRAYQSEHITPYRRLLKTRRSEVGLPTDVFRYARIASFPESETARVFQTSGTTNGARGKHFFRDLSLYDLGARIAARRMLFPDQERMRLILLVAPEDVAPESSLGYMLARFVDWFASSHAYVWPVEPAAFDAAVAHSPGPVAILGTSFAFVHLCDESPTTWPLPEGSRIMQTGGFKGRSRSLDAEAMRALLSERFEVPDSHIVGEYGMTELSSQMYETTLVDALARKASPRRYWTPWWMRATPVDAETLERTDGMGILRLEDCANLDSVSCIQTADRASLQGDGFQLLGRDPSAVPRGCSLATEEALA